MIKKAQHPKQATDLKLISHTEWASLDVHETHTHDFVTQLMYIIILIMISIGLFLICMLNSASKQTVHQHLQEKIRFFLQSMCY